MPNKRCESRKDTKGRLGTLRVPADSVALRLSKVPGVGYENIVSEKKSSLSQEARVNHLG
jgi:hypothetical protein